MESLQIHMTSNCADIVVDNNKSNISFTLPEFEISIENYIFVSITHAVIPMSFYNITSNNNVLVYTVNGVVNTFVIPKGNYNIKDLLSILSSNLTNFTITYTKITNKITFTHSTYDFIFNSSSTCFTLLGFVLNSNYSSSNMILISNQVIDLATNKCICICSNLPTKNINMSISKSNHSILESIPIDVAPNGILTYKGSGFRVNTETNNINIIELKLMNQNGYLLDLNGLDWSITIQFDIVRFTD